MRRGIKHKENEPGKLLELVNLVTTHLPSIKKKAKLSLF